MNWNGVAAQLVESSASVHVAPDLISQHHIKEGTCPLRSSRLSTAILSLRAIWDIHDLVSKKIMKLL